MGSEVEVTAADREKARDVLRHIAVGTEARTVEIVAQALAEERAKARVPFLALAEDLARHTVEPETDRDRGFITGLDMGARYIRRVAEDPPEVSET